MRFVIHYWFPGQEVKGQTTDFCSNYLKTLMPDSLVLTKLQLKLKLPQPRLYSYYSGNYWIHNLQNPKIWSYYLEISFNEIHEHFVSRILFFYMLVHVFAVVIKKTIFSSAPWPEFCQIFLWPKFIRE